MHEETRINSGNYISMKRLYDAYELNDGKFGCRLTQLQLRRTSKIFDKWEVRVSYKYKNNYDKNKFNYEVDMSYDFFWNRTHAVLYYLG